LIRRKTRSFHGLAGAEASMTGIESGLIASSHVFAFPSANRLFHMVTQSRTRTAPLGWPARIVAAIKGSIAAVAVALSTVILFSLMIPLALVKLVLPWLPVRKVCDRWLNNLATTWIAINNGWMALVGRTHWDVRGADNLNLQGWYLVISNHRSWVDILVLQKVFSRRVPLLKFFLKRELIYVPVIGLAWWALDFPFMHRKGGAAGRDDLERTRQACEKFKRVPTSVINFLEGTRFTQDKHDAQKSPYRNLLKPKVGGVAVALATLGARFDAVLDVTIVYPDGSPTFWDLLTGRVTQVRVEVRQLPIPAELTAGDYARDAGMRARVQAWVNTLWQDKDALIDTLTAPTGSGSHGPQQAGS
jgi:1-acyl-sn-glycerol-3-phosphate acyltransferase